ncbi:serine/threonine protein kinase [Sphingopyxis sp. BSN-002]|uniref:serine/threonine protein kinase n=1 Tax=Sphingopyxis sp. BSN-002 TaxID=2911495 RepID=UPI001EDBDAE2|nr:serine/threonine-protein kinase [Sphingopyxis sp. BSN-002]UKK84843.1 serine/threonine protein kinase [Sphingopyxis sp. BSN-002]
MGDEAAKWSAVQGLFDQLVDLPPSDQDRLLDRSDAPAEVVAKARAMLIADRAAGVLDRGSPLFAGEQEPAGDFTSLATGQVIGGFTIDAHLGRGGMGEVYLAHRTTDDFVQTVAIKLLRIEASDRAQLFSRERRLLASLNHPNIARLIDGGVSADGRPYMVMDYVDGQPIDVFVREHETDLANRLRLFGDICDAVAYAHAHLVVHRDLKPSNIMIDGTGEVKLLDFGIAKLIDGDFAAPETTQAMLTPDYAAPEQLGGEQVTVSTDVYALGTILFQLLTGSSPWQRDGSSVPMMVRRILQEDPPLPSKIAAREGAPVRAQAIGGDLDAIILKAMRRDPDQRYGSVSDLADDVARHLALKPVKAREGTTRYRFGRFVRRNKLAVTAGAAAVTALLVGVGGIVWQSHQTAIERDLAQDAARRSASINQMLQIMLRDTAEADVGDEVTVKQMLNSTADRLVNSVDTSADSATLVSTLFDLYINLEDPVGADALITKAMARGIGKSDAVATAQLKVRAAASAASLGKIDAMAPLIDAAEPVFRTDPVRFRRELVDVNLTRAQLFRRTGRIEDAITLLTHTLDNADIAYADNYRDRMTVYNNLLAYMIEANQVDAMPAIFDRADKITAANKQGDSTLALAMDQLKAVRFAKLDQPARAEPILQRVIARRRAAFGRSAGLAVDLFHLGRVKISLGKYREASLLLGESWPMANEKLSPAAQPTLIIGGTLIEALAETGDIAQANVVLGKVDQILKDMPSGPVNAIVDRARAITLLKMGRVAEATAAADRAEAIFKAMGPTGETYLKAFPALRKRLAAGR